MIFVMNSQDPVPPPMYYGKRLLPNLVHVIAKSHPQRTFISVAKTVDPRDGFDDVSFAAFSAAIHACSWWLKKALGRSNRVGEPIYSGIMPQDPLNLVLALAIVRTGYVIGGSNMPGSWQERALTESAFQQMVHTFPTNSVETNIDLLDQVQCAIFLKPDQCLDINMEISKCRRMRTVSLPSLEYFQEQECRILSI